MTSSTNETANLFSLLKHIKVVDEGHELKLWFGKTHITTAEKGSVAAISMVTFALDRDATVMKAEKALDDMEKEIERSIQKLRFLTDPQVKDATPSNNLPIPQGIYWDGVTGQFKTNATHRGLGRNFHELWKNRTADFPQQPW